MISKPPRQLRLPHQICFRVTRDCNARCRFCLAPPEGDQPTAPVLDQRIDWLLARGVDTLHFCGGEPTLHPALGELLQRVRTGGGKNRLTTNAIVLSDRLLLDLRETATAVKVSLHGDQPRHDALVGVSAFKHTSRNLERLREAGIPTSIQSTLVANQTEVIDWLIDYCLQLGVRRLSLMPFIPRGRGTDCRDAFALTPAQRRGLRNQVKERRHGLNGRLDLRWLDFTSQPLVVVEADGRIVREAATEQLDEVIYRIPTG